MNTDPEHEPPTSSSTTAVLPVAPSMGPALESVEAPRERNDLTPRAVLVSALAVALALAAAAVAQLLAWLIAVVTNLAFYGRLSSAPASPAQAHVGLWVLLLPATGGLIVGLMARFGSKAIRGHGIPEAMEQVLFNQSRVAPRLMFLKPLSAAIAIGTGGPFGAEGPIIATGGALGSVTGQLLHTTADERKTLLAAGAAAGMAATFGSPVSAVLLALELLLFELKPRSLVPVALAAATAAGARAAWSGAEPPFPMAAVHSQSSSALLVYGALGLLMGVASVGVTRLVYAIEDGFDRLPIHWMWWPALGGLAVGISGYFCPRALGVGYDNIEQIVNGDIAGRALLVLCLFKLVAWSLSLGSGTSGGTLAPLLTLGGGGGALVGAAVASALPHLGVDPRVAAAVGMAALFAGASRAPLASIVFAFETTQQPGLLLPLLAGGAGSYLVSCLWMRNSIMTEKIARRGQPIPQGFSADDLGRRLVRDFASASPVCLPARETVGRARARLVSREPGWSHQGYPVVDERGELVGVVTRRDFLEATASDEATVASLVRRAPVTVRPGDTLREAADRMAGEGVGRLVVVDPAEPRKPAALLSRSDLLRAHERRLLEEGKRERSLPLPKLSMPRKRTA